VSTTSFPPPAYVSQSWLVFSLLSVWWTRRWQNLSTILYVDRTRAYLKSSPLHLFRTISTELWQSGCNVYISYPDSFGGEAVFSGSCCCLFKSTSWMCQLNRGLSLELELTNSIWLCN
jgi:hypothetical protein